MTQNNDTVSRRILVVDDNEEIHKDFKKIFQLDGVAGQTSEAEEFLFEESKPAQAARPRYEIDSAFQGKQGLELVSSAVQEDRPYAVAFVDVRMPPGWDGIETISRLWQVDTDLQVVICTAYSDYSWDDMLQKLGYSDRLAILKKPFDSVEVQQLALAFTEKWRLHQTAKNMIGDLEKMVQERTVELTAANQMLRGEIAERQRGEQERQLMEVQLRQAQKLEAIGQLAAGVAHEINTPIQYVGDNTRFVQDSFQTIQQVLQSHQELLNALQAGAAAPELISRAQQILQSSDLDYLFWQIPPAIKETLEGVERVSKIVRAMKEFSHPGSKDKTTADLNHAIETTVTVARNEWKYVADVKLELDPNLPQVSCFIGEFNQAILNLIVNAAHAIGDAVKQTPGAKGVITLNTRRDGEFVEVRVGDSGTGIPEAARPKIFEPFFTTKEVGKGTGQGLSVVYGSVVKRHGGTVTFETETGKGTTFIIRLPLQPPPAKGIEA